MTTPPSCFRISSSDLKQFTTTIGSWSRSRLYNSFTRAPSIKENRNPRLKKKRRKEKLQKHRDRTKLIAPDTQSWTFLLPKQQKNFPPDNSPNTHTLDPKEWTSLISENTKPHVLPKKTYDIRSNLFFYWTHVIFYKAIHEDAWNIMETYPLQSLHEDYASWHIQEPPLSSHMKPCPADHWEWAVGYIPVHQAS